MRAAFSIRLFLTACSVLLLCSAPTAGQALKKEGLTGKLDSLNRRAYDYPAEVIRTCDSLLIRARLSNNAKESRCTSNFSR